jgi:hypothetical protein
VLLLEFLNRISFFSILTWGFFFIAVVAAILLTGFRSVWLRKYRSSIIAISTSAILLGVLSASLPFFLSRLNPDQSRLTAIDQLVSTEWVEPVSNPETELPEDEIAWAKGLHYRFKYKLGLGYEFQKALSSGENGLVLMDKKGNLHGFNAYSGLNHWMIPLRINQLLDVRIDQKKLYLLERTSLDALRVSCVDIKDPALLWQRTIPRSKEGALEIDPASQILLISAGSNGVWALKLKTGEIDWKRPEIFSKTVALVTDRHILVFEPARAGLGGKWHFLDLNSGRVLQKTPHAYPDIKRFDRKSNTPPVMGLVDSENLFLFNPRDLSQSWSHHADGPIALTEFLGDQYLSLLDQTRLELRSIAKNELKWQKKISPIPAPWVKSSPDLSVFAMPSEAGEEPQGISFFRSENGDYLGSAHTSEPLSDLYFLGDWLYLMSENHVWALKHESNQ